MEQALTCMISAVLRVTRSMKSSIRACAMPVRIISHTAIIFFRSL